MRFSVTSLPPSRVPAALLDEAETLTGALARLAAEQPAHEALLILDRRGNEQRLTIGDLWTRAQDYAAAFAPHARGAIVLIILPTGPELLGAYFGAMLAGAVPALVAGPSNRFADPGTYAQHVGRIADNAEAPVICGDDDVLALLREGGGRFVARARLLTPADIRASAAVIAPAQRGDDVATVQYSSGSTGTPKGVLLTHAALLNNIRAIRDGLGLTAADISVNWIPLYHDMGLVGAFLQPLLNGCPTVLIPTTDFMRDPALWLWAIHRYRGTFAWAPNFAYALCAKRIADADLEGLDLSSWRFAINAAEPILASTIDAFAARYAPYGYRPETMRPVWGLAENVTAATAHPVGVPPRIEMIDRAALAAGIARPTTGDGVRSVSVGHCLPGYTVQIRSGTRLLPDRHVGRIWLRSSSLTIGYHRDPVHTAEALVDGWLDTGDCGYVADGDLFFVTREKDLLVVGGEKYAPHDLETVISAVPGIRDGCAVVFGVMNAERGTEDLVAVAETRERGAALEALREAVRRAVTAATGLSLRHVLLVPPGGVQKTTSGKLARSATRQRYATTLADELGR
jgi:acyl-CoA synthetase (AMP-forming)/AMP-acid ligase II